MLDQKTVGPQSKSVKGENMNKLVGQQIAGSEKVEKLIQELVAEVVEKAKSIEGVRPPRPELEGHFLHLLQAVQTLRGRDLQFPYIGSGAGRGPYVELEDGSVKLDLINGIGVNLVGHSHPRVIAASIRGALSDIVMQGNLEPNKEYLRLGEKLVKLASHKSRLKHFWLSTCGTMANENALKMARQKNSPARFIMAMEGAFAGRSTMMAEVTDNPAYKVGLPEYHEVLRVPFYNKKDPQSTEKSLRIMKDHAAKHPNDIAVFSFEPVQGEGGFNVAPKEFFVPLLDFCRSQKIAVWADEVQTFTRTGEVFAFQTLDIGDYIDICTIAKTAQNGATLFTDEYNPKPGLIAGTFSGSSAAMSAGCEILEILVEGGYLGAQGKIAKIHRDFVNMLNQLNATTCKGLLNDAGGLGLMVSVTPFDGSKEKVNQLLKTLFKNGLIAYSCGKNPMKLRFLIPIVIETAHIEAARQIIEKSVLEMARG